MEGAFDRAVVTSTGTHTGELMLAGSEGLGAGPFLAEGTVEPPDGAVLPWVVELRERRPRLRGMREESDRRRTQRPPAASPPAARQDDERSHDRLRAVTQEPPLSPYVGDYPDRAAG